MIMKKILAMVTLLVTVGSANAFDMPWDNDNYGYEDNGIFAFNGYDYFDPRWFSTEFTNMINEFDDDNDYPVHTARGTYWNPASTHNFSVVEK